MYIFNIFFIKNFSKKIKINFNYFKLCTVCIFSKYIFIKKKINFLGLLLNKIISKQNYEF